LTVQGDFNLVEYKKAMLAFLFITLVTFFRSLGVVLSFVIYHIISQKTDWLSGNNIRRRGFLFGLQVGIPIVAFVLAWFFIESLRSSQILKIMASVPLLKDPIDKVVLGLWGLLPEYSENALATFPSTARRARIFFEVAPAMFVAVTAAYTFWAVALPFIGATKFETAKDREWLIRSQPRKLSFLSNCGLLSLLLSGAFCTMHFDSFMLPGSGAMVDKTPYVFPFFQLILLNLLAQVYCASLRSNNTGEQNLEKLPAADVVAFQEPKRTD
jgi:hypothetical protein